MVVYVGAGVMRLGGIVQRILNELEAGQPHRVKRLVIGSARVADGDRICAVILEGVQPRLEDGPHHVVALQIRAADLAGAVVQVEVTRELGMFRLERHGFAIPEVILHIGPRSQQPLFFAGPQRHSHRARHLQIQRFQDAHSFQHYRAPGAIIGCAGAAGPGVQVAAQHHQLVFLAGARQFTRHGERILGVVQELVLNIELQRHRNLLVDEPRDAIVLLHLQRHRRRRHRFLGILRPARHAEYDAAGGPIAGGDRHQHSLVGEELIHLIAKLFARLAIERLSSRRPRLTRRLSGDQGNRIGKRRARRRIGRQRLRGQLGIGEALQVRFSLRKERPGRL